MMIPADAKSVVGGYWRLSRSQRALVSALAVVLIPTCLALAYLLSDIWHVNQTKEKELSAAAARDTLLLSGYDTAVKVFTLAQAAYTTPSLTDSLRPEFQASVNSLRTLGSLYITYLTDVPAEERTDLLQAFNRLWTRIDGLVARSERVFTTGSSGSAGALLPNNAVSLVGSPSAFFSSMRLELDHVMRAEMMVHLRLVGHLRTELERTTIRGFIVALVLFSVGTVLAIIILRRNRLSERRRRRYETVLEASLNPIELVDREGRVTYVNPAFERMMGLDAKDLIGTNLFEHVETAPVSRRATEIWREAARELEASKAWTGEVKVRREGKPSQTTLLIISPVLNVDAGFL